MKVAVAAIGLIVISGCSGSLTDAEDLWCRRYDHPITALLARPDEPHGNLVADVAQDLDIPVPATIIKYDAAFLAAEVSPLGAPIMDSSWDDYLEPFLVWRESTDYARACKAAFDLHN